MAINTNMISAASFVQGIKDKGTNVNVSGTIPSTFVAGSTTGPVVTTASIPFPTVSALSLMRIQFHGLSAGNSNYWFPLSGAVVVQEGNFQIVCIVKGTASGKTVSIGLNNWGAGATFNSCTFDIYTHFYQFPWIP